MNFKRDSEFFNRHAFSLLQLVIILIVISMFASVSMSGRGVERRREKETLLRYYLTAYKRGIMAKYIKENVIGDFTKFPKKMADVYKKNYAVLPRMWHEPFGGEWEFFVYDNDVPTGYRWESGFQNDGGYTGFPTYKPAKVGGGDDYILKVRTNKHGANDKFLDTGQYYDTYW